jgi:hypothetical protein
VYPKQTLICSALLMFLMGLGSRRQFRFESGTPAFVRNLNILSGSQVETAPHDDTIVYYLEKVDPAHAEQLPPAIVRRLIRMKALDHARLYGRFTVVIDGTGQLFFHARHCERCLTKTLADGRVLYFHHVLEAKLVTPEGYAFSLATEFIENLNPAAKKQDCELKAFVRLAETLKRHFPQLPILLLGDALYANQTVFAICRANDWRFIFTFKAGSLPALFAEYETLRDMEPQNRVKRREGTVLQRFAWVNDLEYEGHRLAAFECRETERDKEHSFAWITDLKVGCASVVTLANRGGRLRWKIENEGFNIQKNGGYELEHAYSQNENAGKSFYFLLQVAHALNQLMIKGGLLGDFFRTFGSIRNYLRRLAESLRNVHIEPADICPSNQIMWDSS